MPSYSKQIHDLPDEILRGVFLLLVQEEFYQYRGIDDETSPTIYPWLFSGVCKRWRRICLDSGQLWSYVSLASHHEKCSRSDSKPQYETAPLLATLLQLERSRNAGLFIDGSETCSCKPEIARFRALAAYADRWQSLEINLGKPEDHRFLQSLLPVGQCLASLRELNIFNLLSYGGELMLPLTIETLPELRRVTFSEMGALDTRFDSFTWTNLTYICLPSYAGGAEDFLGILSQCANLKELLFDFADGHRSNDSISTGHEVVSLPHLTLINLENNSRPAPDRLLPYIQAPNLRSVEYGHICAGFLATFIDFITPSAGSLTTLIICYPASFYVEYLHIFEVSRQLQYLALYHPGSHRATEAVSCDDFLRAAIRWWSPSGPNFLPRLGSLSLHELEFDPIILTSMVMSRIKNSETPKDSGNDSHCLDSTSSSFRAPLKLELQFEDEDSHFSQYLITVVRNVLGRYVDEGRLEMIIV